MKKLLLSIIFYFLGILHLSGHVGHYKNLNYLEYDLFRNNNLIGKHTYKFIYEGDNLKIESEVYFKIKKFNIVLYNYYAKSEENYKDGKFISFKSKTNQNKKEKYVNIQRDSGKNVLKVDGSSFKGETSIDNIIGTWWNHEIVQAKAQISAVSGRIIKQNVEFIGKEDIKIDEKTYQTLHFNFSSSDKKLSDDKKLNTDIWYEDKTKIWIKAAFDKRGYWEYRLKEFR